jgi:hypothetical protein
MIVLLITLISYITFVILLITASSTGYVKQETSVSEVFLTAAAVLIGGILIVVLAL